MTESNEKYRKKRLSEVRIYYENIIHDVEKLDNILIKKMILLSLIDSLAQQYCNYQGNNQKVFTDFVIKFAKNKNFDILSKIDPVTLFYENQQSFQNHGFNLDYIEECSEYTAESISDLTETKKIINAETEEYLKERHKYINLLYKYRSKLVHEFSSPSSTFDSLESNHEIYYLPMTSNDVDNLDEYLELILPYEFIKSLFLECFDNYLKYCELESIDPFKNIKEYRSWYE